jgi:hypothetical protein
MIWVKYQWCVIVTCVTVVIILVTLVTCVTVVIILVTRLVYTHHLFDNRSDAYCVHASLSW